MKGRWSREGGGVGGDEPEKRAAPGTVEGPDHYPETVRMCEVHAALIPLRDEVDDLGLALEKLEELEEYAEEWGNRPLLGLVERARAEFSERQRFLKEHSESLSLAGR